LGQPGHNNTDSPIAADPLSDETCKVGVAMSIAELDFSAANPLDLVEQLVSANEWLFERPTDEELAVCVDGQWNKYQLWFAWREDLSVMQFTCAFDMKVAEQRYADVCMLLAKINERMWIGHFDLCAEDGMLMFRQALMVGDNGASSTQIEELVEIALLECERVFPAFMFLVWGGKSADEALAAAMLETHGEA